MVRYVIWSRKHVCQLEIPVSMCPNRLGSFAGLTPGAQRGAVYVKGFLHCYSVAAA